MLNCDDNHRDVCESLPEFNDKGPDRLRAESPAGHGRFSDEIVDPGGLVYSVHSRSNCSSPLGFISEPVSLDVANRGSVIEDDESFGRIDPLNHRQVPVSDGCKIMRLWPPLLHVRGGEPRCQLGKVVGRQWPKGDAHTIQLARWRDFAPVAEPCSRQSSSSRSGDTRARKNAITKLIDTIFARRRRHSASGRHQRQPSYRAGNQLERASARRSRVPLMVRRFRSARSSTPEVCLLNSMTDSGRRSSFHSVTRQPDSVGSIRYPQVE